MCCLGLCAACVPQVRYRGCKGVLSRNSLLGGRQLQVRRSTEKFTSAHPQLEVCSVASWLPAYLNRQVIIMMDHNGVAPQVSRGTATQHTVHTVVQAQHHDGMWKQRCCMC